MSLELISFSFNVSRNQGCDVKNYINFLSVFIWKQYLRDCAVVEGPKIICMRCIWIRCSTVMRSISAICTRFRSNRAANEDHPVLSNKNREFFSFSLCRSIDDAVHPAVCQPLMTPRFPAVLKQTEHLIITRYIRRPSGHVTFVYDATCCEMISCV